MIDRPRIVTGIARIPAPLSKAAVLIVTVQDTALSDAPATPLCRHRQTLSAGDGPDLPFRLECRLPDHGRITIAARVVRAADGSLAPGDLVTKASVPLTREGAPLTLDLSPL
ncbi:hypothetical protein [Psychromarinibacter sp. S121]|uniref:hypothetical protein n=1 Tax=Psychromarinibacter sp. S121 TaxID=3415127 RepID=UPI003C7E5F0E